MASAKSGTKISVVQPAMPEEVYEADQPDPVAVAEVKADQLDNQEGKYGEQNAAPFKSDDNDENVNDETDKTWIEIVLLDESDEPVPGEAYKVELPDGRVASGTLDNNGFARIDGIDQSGDCKIWFPGINPPPPKN